MSRHSQSPNFPSAANVGFSRNIIPAADGGPLTVTFSKFHSSLCTVGMQQYLLRGLTLPPAHGAVHPLAGARLLLERI